MSNECKHLYQQMSIRHQTIVAYDSESNGAPVRLNRTIMEIEGAIRAHSNLGPEFWEFSVGMAVYLLERRPNSNLFNNITPYEAWFQRKPTISHCRVFGCDAWYHIPKKLRKKLSFKGKRGIFVGYASNQKAYKLWNPVERKEVISRTVLFDVTFARKPAAPILDKTSFKPVSIDRNAPILHGNRFAVLDDEDLSDCDDDPPITTRMLQITENKPRISQKAGQKTGNKPLKFQIGVTQRDRDRP